MKKLIHDIFKGKNLPVNLKLYRDKVIPVYNEYASLELTFHAYTFVEEMEEEKPEIAGQESAVVDELLGALRQISGETVDYAGLIPVMQRLRRDITQKMELFTVYTDRLIVYEYVLNRMELSFRTEKELTKQLADVDEEQFLKNLLSWIFADKDQSVMRGKLRLVVSQVPARMTKSKLFEKIGEAFTLYKDGDRASLDDFIYMLRTASLLFEPSYPPGEYPKIEGILDELEHTDFKRMEEEDYRALAGRLEEGAHEIHDITDFYYSMQRIVNSIYALCLSMPYAAGESKLIHACKAIWRCLSGKAYAEDMLVPLEGRIEEYAEKTSYMESALYEIKESCAGVIEENGLAAFFDDFSTVTSLLSDSLFIDLEKVKEDAKADAGYVKQRTEEFLDELSVHLDEVSRPVKRALTGQILEKLPLLFQKPEEVEDYIRINLLGCQDKAEKLVVMSVLSDLMREEL